MPSRTPRALLALILKPVSFRVRRNQLPSLLFPFRRISWDVNGTPHRNRYFTRKTNRWRGST